MTAQDNENAGKEPRPRGVRAEVASDERTQAVQSRNVRFVWVLLNYALAGDIFYRGYILKQDFALFADIFYIWAATNLVFVVMDLATGGMTARAFKISAVPAIAIGIVAAGFAAIALGHLNPWLVATVGFVILVIVIAVAAAYRRARRRESEV